MNFIVEIKEFSANSNYPDLNTMINYPIKNKSEILKFLKFPAPIAVMTQGIMDYIQNISDNTQSLTLFNFGEWFWTNEMIYHFEKYDLKLNDKFIDYVLSQTNN